MLFSIIIPTYNRCQFIEKTVSSVLDQSYTNFELIIVNDGSTDNTTAVIERIKDDRIKYFEIENSERGAARNFGTRHAKGNYITFLDSDDVLLPDYFKNALESIVKHNSPPFLHLGYDILNLNNKLFFKVDHLKNDDIYCITSGNPLSCTGCFLRSDVSRKFMFNEDRDLAGSEDWELWFRVLANYGIKTDNRISAHMYNHENRSVIMEAQEEKLVLRKELALKYAFSDKFVQMQYAKYYKKIDAFGDGYISLHLALMGDKHKSFYYLKKFVGNYPAALFSKRFLVILKYLIFN